MSLKLSQLVKNIKNYIIKVVKNYDNHQYGCKRIRVEVDNEKNQTLCNRVNSDDAYVIPQSTYAASAWKYTGSLRAIRGQYISYKKMSGGKLKKDQQITGKRNALEKEK